MSTDIEQPEIREATAVSSSDREEVEEEKKVLVAPPKREPLKPTTLCCTIKTAGWIGSNILFWRCTPDSKRFPFVCMVGKDWACGLVTYALHFVPWILFLNFRMSELSVPGQVIGTLLCAIQLSNLLVLTLVCHTHTHTTTRTTTLSFSFSCQTRTTTTTSRAIRELYPKCSVANSMSRI